MAGVKIVTDSGADIPKPLAEELDIAVVPLTVHFGDEEFKDGVDLELSEFYRRLHAGGQPRTTQPSPTDFEAVYRRLQADADAIVSVHLSSELSGTMQSAPIAAAMDLSTCRCTWWTAARRPWASGCWWWRPPAWPRPARRRKTSYSTWKPSGPPEGAVFGGHAGSATAASAGRRFSSGTAQHQALLTIDDGVVVP